MTKRNNPQRIHRVTGAVGLLADSLGSLPHAAGTRERPCSGGKRQRVACLAKPPRTVFTARPLRPQTPFAPFNSSVTMPMAPSLCATTMPAIRCPLTPADRGKW